MRDTFWIGVYPGMSDEAVDRMIAVVKEGLEKSLQIKQ
jgi:CDP-6-deoxy-D-xylo-4-hexulose-3-dehydrase